ncbi:class I SAM-dependent methyltransferase [Streptomyces sp. NPDC057445]|uniref:class I SAM-dependent methyltransferase n=1 Tax=Streptomyces sp. NPDC057445 TaxID=3346136 RepID=UPI003684CD7A
MSDNDQRARLLRIAEYRKSFDERLDRIDQKAPFDSVHHTDTAGSVEIWELPDAEQTWVGRNARYSPTPVLTVRNVLSRCAVKHEEVTFVDVGCGKGRVLLLAAELPFRRVVGVEASEALCAIARSNIEKAGEAGGNGRIDVVHADATQFEVPSDAGLFYFYEPFSAEVADAVLERIEDSIRQYPRKVVLCFTGRGQPDGQGADIETAPVAAAPAEKRDQWNLVEVVSSPDGKFYDSFLYEYTGRQA